MSISVNCPTCGKSYNLNDNMAGKQVRCKHCADTFPVELDAVLPLDGAAADTAEPPRQEPEPQPSAPVYRDSEDTRPSKRRREDEKEREGRKEPASSGSFPWWLVALGGVACVLLLICGGFGLGIYLVIYSASQAANNLSTSINNAAANVNHTPQTPAEAVADLNSGDWFRQQRAAEWLAAAPVNPVDQPQVARALERQLNNSNPFTKSAAASALFNWADGNSVPTLVTCVEKNDGDTSDAAIRALVRLKDPRGVPPIAAQLPHAWKRGNAASALQSLGPMCEGEVAKYAFHSDQGTRTEARRLLKGYGTTDAVLLGQALVELKGFDSNRRSAAAEWLGQTVVVENRRAEVSAALNAVLKDPNQPTRLNGVKAARVWATRDNIPALIAFVDSMFEPHQPPEETYVAMDLLVDFKDERAYWPIAHFCGHPFQHAKGLAYMQKIGTAAEPEVVKHLSDAEPRSREAAWKALGVVGLKANLAKYQATAGKDANLYYIKPALDAIAAR